MWWGRGRTCLLDREDLVQVTTLSEEELLPLHGLQLLFLLLPGLEHPLPFIPQGSQPFPDLGTDTWEAWGEPPGQAGS